jgi:hypothetical protein
MIELAGRRFNTAERINSLRSKLATTETVLRGKACVYATGSSGRGEAGVHSDLDLFIVGRRKGEPLPEGETDHFLSQLDEICVKADLISATRQLGIPDLDGDGKFLSRHSVHGFTKELGTPNDDVTNTFTARLLLLLESCPLLEPHVYEQVIGGVIKAYWRDYDCRKSEFMPAFLANDILRLWRTFCVNYEARTERIPANEKAKGKLKNYKLKHSRLLTCYSALLFLLAKYRDAGTVHPSDATSMVYLSPTQRLEQLRESPCLAHIRVTIERLLEQYEKFLVTTSIGDKELVERFMNKEESQKYLKDAYDFGDLFFEAFDSLGQGNKFYRLLVV